ncbi:MAG TPA: tetratricopeptide repeat protein, partial [Thermoanaerobaculia bacterium]|nr:tetratricopeptide repeat protein [Thermoanaerobaculia bacterium]
MRRQLLCTLGLLFMATALEAANSTQILLIARDLKDHPLSGFRFSYEQVKSKPTNRAGATELDIPPKQQSGKNIKIQLVPGSKRAVEWFLVNPQVNIPTYSDSAAVVLMRRSELRQIAAIARDAPRATAARSGELTAENRKRALVDEAARHGLTAEELETAIRSFGETQDPRDRGVAAYLEGRYSQAEELLSGAVEKKESDLVEILRYLGAAQYEQAKYRVAAETFRKAVALRGGDAALLSWLGGSLHKLAEWTEAEPLMRRALAIDEKRLGPEHPKVAIRLSNLAQLLQDTNRLGEAEPLMRRALAIDENGLGPEHPNVAIRLSNLAWLLLSTNRLSEAEPLMRRALAIDEKSLGPEHPDVATDLNNLADLLLATPRLGEAEPLLRRALAIDEKNLGPEHPKVAFLLSNLAQLLQATNRLGEAEPLLRRALAIGEKSLGPEHPKVATLLNNLAQLLKSLKRLGEAEPLMRRALTIDEKSLGAEHHDVARDLNNLADLLQATNRLGEAEPLLR